MRGIKLYSTTCDIGRASKDGPGKPSTIHFFSLQFDQILLVSQQLYEQWITMHVTCSNYNCREFHLNEILKSITTIVSDWQLMTLPVHNFRTVICSSKYNVS